MNLSWDRYVGNSLLKGMGYYEILITFYHPHKGGIYVYKNGVTFTRNYYH